MSQENWVVIYRSGDQHETEILRLYLLDSGIPAVVMHKGDSARILPDLNELYVNADDAVRATHLISKNYPDGRPL